jgi:hypothetical protein
MVKIQDVNKLARILSKMRIEILGLRQIKKGVKVKHPITGELISLLTPAPYQQAGKDRLDQLKAQFVNTLDKMDWDVIEDDDVEE